MRLTTLINLCSPYEILLDRVTFREMVTSNCSDVTLCKTYYKHSGSLCITANSRKRCTVFLVFNMSSEFAEVLSDEEDQDSSSESGSHEYNSDITKLKQYDFEPFASDNDSRASSTYRTQTQTLDPLNTGTRKYRTL